MKTYYISSDDSIEDISHSIEKGKALIGEGTTEKDDLINTGHIYISDVINPAVYEHLYNEENRELKFVWAPPKGKYGLWVKGQYIYFKELS